LRLRNATRRGPLSNEGAKVFVVGSHGDGVNGFAIFRNGEENSIAAYFEQFFEYLAVAVASDDVSSSFAVGISEENISFGSEKIVDEKGAFSAFKDGLVEGSLARFVLKVDVTGFVDETSEDILIEGLFGGSVGRRDFSEVMECRGRFDVGSSGGSAGLEEEEHDGQMFTEGSAVQRSPIVFIAIFNVRFKFFHHFLHQL